MIRRRYLRWGATIFFSLCLLFLFPQHAPAQPEQPDTFNGALDLLIDDNTPGILRIGDIQILYGRFQIPCAYPAQLCTVTVKFAAPFIEYPVVTLTSLSNFNTSKSAFATLVQERLTPASFMARVRLDANIPSLKKIPWMAIGRWR